MKIFEKLTFRSIFLFSFLVAPLYAASPDFISIGGVGYKSSCDSNGLTLKSLNSTYRLFGYKNSMNHKYFPSEVIILKNDCSVASYELGKGKWGQAGGSNAGFTLDFTNFTDDKTNNMHTLEFYGQEPYCKTLVNPCFCK